MPRRDSNKKLIIFTFSLLVLGVVVPPAAHSADACPKNIPGESQHWAIAVCESRAETDDFEAPAVQECIAKLMKEDHILESPSRQCELNRKYKSELCKLLVRLKVEPSLEACIKSVTNIPSVVRNGGA